MSIKQKLMICLIIMLVFPIVMIVLLTFVMGAILVIIHPTVEFSAAGVEISNPIIVKFLVIWAAASIFIIFIGVIAITAYLSKSILRPVKDLTVAMDKMKNGDLTYEFSGSADKEIKELCRAYDELRLNLQINAAERVEYENEQRMLIANLSHDIKTPVTSILGYVEGIRDGVADTPEKLDKYLYTIHSKAETIELMAENMSLYAKLEMKRLSYNMENISMNDFLEKSVAEYELDLQQGGIELLFNLSDDNCIIRGDKEKLRRVFANIITNAIKYKSGSNGLLSVGTELGPHGLLITFADTGRGIAPGDLEHIFESFYRGDSSRNAKVGGNGLGLSICKKIIEDHGGKIWIRSELNSGTKVTILLPITGYPTKGETVR